jgi:hypothetical protein
MFWLLPENSEIFINKLCFSLFMADKQQIEVTYELMAIGLNKVGEDMELSPINPHITTAHGKSWVPEFRDLSHSEVAKVMQERLPEEYELVSAFYRRSTEDLDDLEMTVVDALSQREIEIPYESFQRFGEKFKVLVKY